jgi:hypothetical protein
MTWLRQHPADRPASTLPAQLQPPAHRRHPPASMRRRGAGAVVRAGVAAAHRLHPAHRRRRRSCGIAGTRRHRRQARRCSCGIAGTRRHRRQTRYAPRCAALRQHPAHRTASTLPARQRDAGAVVRDDVAAAAPGGTRWHRRQTRYAPRCTALRQHPAHRTAPPAQLRHRRHPPASTPDALRATLWHATPAPGRSHGIDASTTPGTLRATLRGAAPAPGRSPGIDAAGASARRWRGRARWRGCGAAGATAPAGIDGTRQHGTSHGIDAGTSAAPAASTLPARHRRQTRYAPRCGTRRRHPAHRPAPPASMRQRRAGVVVRAGVAAAHRRSCGIDGTRQHGAGRTIAARNPAIRKTPPKLRQNSHENRLTT